MLELPHTTDYMDHLMHDLKVERSLDEAPLGPIKTSRYVASKTAPPYMHDGRCLTLEDSVEFFNLVLGTKLTDQDRKDLVAFMRQL